MTETVGMGIDYRCDIEKKIELGRHLGIVGKLTTSEFQKYRCLPLKIQLLTRKLKKTVCAQIVKSQPHLLHFSIF
jgi:hypothetical protein